MSFGHTSVGHPVDVASGIVSAVFQDVVIPGKVSLTWTRLYSTAAIGNTYAPLGTGWFSPYFATLRRQGPNYILLSPQGFVDRFADPEQKLEKGEVLRNLGTCQELAIREGRYVVTRWSVETGRVARFVFRESVGSSPWTLASVEDLHGQGLDLLYDSQGRVSAIRQRLERRALVLHYGALGRLDGISFRASDGAMSRLMVYDYDDGGRLHAATDVMGDSEIYEYDSTARLVKETRKDGGVFYFSYDEKGRCTKTSGLDRFDEKSLQYLDHIGWTNVTDSAGNVTRFQWNAEGQITCQIDALGGVRRTEYDEHGRISRLISPRGQQLQYAYDGFGNRSVSVDPLGRTTSIQYNSDHLISTYTNGAGSAWTRHYDDSGRLVRTEDPNGSQWKFSYDAQGNLIETVDPNGARKQQRFTENGVLESASDWEGNWTRYRFDPMGRLLERTGPTGQVTRYRYDGLFNLVEIRRWDGSHLEYRYDPRGNLISASDGSGARTTYRYGTCGRLLERTDALGHVSRYRWGTEPRRLDAVTNANGETYSFAYDPLGRVVQETGFDGREIRFEYDTSGNVIAIINGLNERVTYVRDAAGQLVEKLFPDGYSAKFEYDAAGHLVLAETPDCSIKLTRDKVGRVIAEQQDEFVVVSERDPLGNIIRLKTTLGHELAYTFAASSLSQSVQLNGQRMFLCERNADGDEVLRSLPGRAKLYQSYDSGGRLSEQILSRYGAQQNKPSDSRSSSLVHRVYRYGNNGALISVQDTGRGTAEYIYDPGRRLVHLGGNNRLEEQFTYDRTGNISSRTVNGSTHEGFEYGAGDLLVKRGRTEYSNDGNRRMTARTDYFDSSSGRKWLYTWNSADQLRSVRTPGGEVWKYTYDAFGRRTGKQGVGKSVRFIWHQNTIVHVIENGNLSSTWVYSPESLTPRATIQNGAVYTVVADHLGTPTEIVDSSGQIAWRATYTAWGNIHEESGQTVDCPFRFSGQWFDRESGLHYNRFRYYDPRAGRYISADPLRLWGGWNLYSYARNPVEWIDPFGLITIYRGMKPDSSGSSPMLPTDPNASNPGKELGVRYPDPSDPKARPDVHPSDGMVKADPHEGMSANTDVDAIPPHRKPPEFNEPGKKGDKSLNMFALDTDTLEQHGLQFELDPEPGAKHGVVKPLKDMTPEEYDAALASTQKDWKKVTPEDLEKEEEEKC